MLFYVLLVAERKGGGERNHQESIHKIGVQSPPPLAKWGEEVNIIVTMRVNLSFIVQLRPKS